MKKRTVLQLIIIFVLLAVIGAVFSNLREKKQQESINEEDLGRFEIPEDIAATLPDEVSNVGSEPGSYRSSIEHDGLIRSFVLHIPTNYDGSRAFPLVVALHGGGGDADSQIALSRMSETADANDFIVVYPDGYNKAWNDGRIFNKDKTGDVDDVGFIRTLVMKIEATYNINEQRVYATGMSNGGIMSHRLACDASDVFAAIAPVAAAISAEYEPKCNPTESISVLAIQGTKDRLVKYDGGSLRRNNTDTVLSAEESIEFWANANGCGLDPSYTEFADTDPSDGTTATRSGYPCPSGIDVQLITIEGGGHTWPQGYPYLPELIIGKVSQDFNGSQVVWDFLSAHTL